MSELADVPDPIERSAPPALPLAVEIVSAWTQAGDDPAFFWHAVQRVMADVVDGVEPSQRLAEIVFGLSSLGGILAQHLADATDTSPDVVLQQLAAACAGPLPR